jgi:putative transcriptional regulator
VSFKSARERASLTQEEAAERFDVDQSTVHAWETGKWMPRASLLPHIAAVYGCKIDDLFKDEQNPRG